MLAEASSFILLATDGATRHPDAEDDVAGVSRVAVMRELPITLRVDA